MGSFFSWPSDFAPVATVGGGWGDLLGSTLQSITSLASRSLPAIRGTPAPPAIPGIPANPPFPIPGAGGAYNVKVNVVGRLRHRRMNACNPRALKRAIRRVKSFDKFARQSIKITKKVKTPRGRSKCR